MKEFTLLTESDAAECCRKLLDVAMSGTGHVQLNAIGMVFDRIYGRVPLASRVALGDFPTPELPDDLRDMLNELYPPSEPTKTNQPYPTPGDYAEIDIAAGG